MKIHRKLYFVLCGLGSYLPVHALELNLSTWISEGKTQWAHNAQMLDPDLGNPTSRLTYDEASGPIFELTAKQQINDSFDIKGGVLLGQIDDGKINDEDFLSAEYVTSQGYPTTEDFKFLETVSDITDGEVSGFNVEAGYSFKTSGNSMRLNLGYMNWSETYDATGGSIVVCRVQGCPPVGTTIIPNGVLALTNEVTWDMIYLGADVSLNVADNLTFDIGLKYMPIGDVENIDTHHLRSDLAKPSVRQEADGSGWQFDFMARYNFTPQLSVSGGYRIRSLTTDYTKNGDITYTASGESFAADLHTLESDRSGLLLGVNYAF